MSTNKQNFLRNLLTFRFQYQIALRVIKISALIFLLLTTVNLAKGQNQEINKSKAELKKQKQENLRRIEEAEKILNETQSKKQANLGQLSAINEQIKNREALINSISQEIKLLNKNISEVNSVILAMEKDLENLKEEYAAMLYATQKSSNSFDRLTFIFSSESFNQLLMRIRYLDQYAETRQHQMKQIQKVHATLQSQKSDLKDKKNERTQLLQEQIEANKKLHQLRQEQRSIVNDLAQRESQLKKELKKRRAAVKRLNKLIADLIKQEMEATKRREAEGKDEINEENAALSSAFQEKKNHLTWPVESGFISQHFGVHPHPVMKNITIENKGVDIQTKKNAEVKSVFEGRVKTVARVPGMNNVIIMQHGNYYTLYARLKNVNVKNGENVKANEVIGTVHTNSEGVSVLQFQVWKKNKLLNPEKWLDKPPS